MGHLRPLLISGLSILERFELNRIAATDRKDTGNGQRRSLTSRQVGAVYFRVNSGTLTRRFKKPPIDCFAEYGTQRERWTTYPLELRVI